MFQNYLEQVIAEYEFLNNLALDIAKHDFCDEVVNHAAKYADIWIGNKSINKMSEGLLCKRLEDFRNNEDNIFTINFRDCFCYFLKKEPRYTDLYTSVVDVLDGEDDPTYEELITALKKQNAKKFEKDFCPNWIYIPNLIPKYIPYNPIRKGLKTNVSCLKCGSFLTTTQDYHNTFYCQKCVETFQYFEITSITYPLLLSTEVPNGFFEKYKEQLLDICDVYGCDILQHTPCCNTLTIGWNKKESKINNRILYEVTKQIMRLIKKEM